MKIPLQNNKKRSNDFLCKTIIPRPGSCVTNRPKEKLPYNLNLKTNLNIHTTFPNRHNTRHNHLIQIIIILATLKQPPQSLNT